CRIHLPPGSALLPYTTLFRSPAMFCPAFWLIVFSQLHGWGGRAFSGLAFYAKNSSKGQNKHRQLSEAETESPIFALGMLTEKIRSEEHTSELQSRENLVCRLL